MIARLTGPLQRLDLTPGQVWTVGLGLALGTVLLATSVPAAWERTAPVSAALPSPPPGTTPLTPLGTATPPPTAPPLAPGAPLSATTPTPFPQAPAAPAQQPDRDGDPGPSPAAPGPRPSSPSAAAPESELRVLEGGWTTTSTEPNVPDGGLPVSARVGEQVSTAHLRLTGSTPVLTVAVATATGTSIRPEDARVRACRITVADWRAERPGPAVAFDPQDCVDGVFSPGAVTFDLSDYGDRSGPAGFAVIADVRAATPPRTFRLVLTP